MIVSIGMLAWNEELIIENTIRSLFQQSVFTTHSGRLPVRHWEVMVVPNGCSDGTAQKAINALNQHVPKLENCNITFSVVEVKEAGKSNSWNRLIHEFSRQDSDYVVMIDSDIEFDHPDTIYNSIKLLVDKPSVVVSVDKPLKHFIKKENHSLLERLSLEFSNERFERNPGIAGSFYCAKGAVLRNIWMPHGLPGEDGFLKAMILTDCFRSDVDFSLIERAADASHFYEGLTNFRAIFNHELRLVIGTALNCYFTWDFLKFATDPKGDGAGYLIRNCLDHDPNWYVKFISNEIRNRGWWVLPRGMVFRNITKLRGMGFGKKVKRIPLAILAFLIDLPIFFVANRRLKSGKAIGYW